MHVKIFFKKMCKENIYVLSHSAGVWWSHGHFARGKKFPFGRGKSHVIATLQSRIKKMERGFMSVPFKILNRTTLNRHSLADKVG